MTQGSFRGISAYIGRDQAPLRRERKCTKTLAVKLAVTGASPELTIGRAPAQFLGQDALVRMHLADEAEGFGAYLRVRYTLKSTRKDRLRKARTSQLWGKSFAIEK
jgi:hypothetical protein